jgi:hypothetical protein
MHQEPSVYVDFGLDKPTFKPEDIKLSSEVYEEPSPVKVDSSSCATEMKSASHATSLANPNPYELNISDAKTMPGQYYSEPSFQQETEVAEGSNVMYDAPFCDPAMYGTPMPLQPTNTGYIELAFDKSKLDTN